MQSFNKVEGDTGVVQQIQQSFGSAVQNKQRTNLQQQNITEQIESDMHVVPLVKSIRYKSQRTYVAEPSESSGHFYRNMHNKLDVQAQQDNLFVEHTRSEFASGKTNFTNNSRQIKIKESYLRNLDEEIKRLSRKIGKFQQFQDVTRPRTVEGQRQNSRAMSEQCARKDRSSTVERNRQRCGKIFRKQQVIGSRQNPKGSTYYKWYPLVQEDKRITEDLNADLNHLSPWQKVKKSISNYRTKHRVISSLSKNQPSFGKNSQEINLQSNSTIKPVFRTDVADWQIKNISDNFRYKILKKLQIPKQFPLNAPSPDSSMQDYRRLSKKVYSMFGVSLQNMENRLIVRKFKNGVYFQLESDRNVVWYFSGVFYLGSWQTDLPSEGEKNGFGFQYVPSKYVYLGEFKAGVRHGHGVIQVFGSNGEQGNQFMGYDGEWANGRPHGEGKQIDELNTKYIGSFDQGQRSGHAIILSREGVYYEGQVYKGLKQGMGMERLANGDCYNGIFHQGYFHGKGIYKWKDGSTYQGEFVRGLRQGNGIWKSCNADQFEGQYFQDLKNGWGRFKWANGEMYQGYFKNDKRDGEGTYRHPKGKTGKFLWEKGEIVHRLYCEEEQRYRCRLMQQRK